MRSHKYRRRSWLTGSDIEITGNGRMPPGSCNRPNRRLDFEVPFGGYLGHGGEIGFNDEQLDVVTSAAALSQITKNILLFSTVHVTYAFHPLHFARLGPKSITCPTDGGGSISLPDGLQKNTRCSGVN